MGPARHMPLITARTSPRSNTPSPPGSANAALPQERCRRMHRSSGWRCRAEASAPPRSIWACCSRWRAAVSFRASTIYRRSRAEATSPPASRGCARTSPRAPRNTWATCRWRTEPARCWTGCALTAVISSLAKVCPAGRSQPASCRAHCSISSCCCPSSCWQ